MLGVPGAEGFGVAGSEEDAAYTGDSGHLGLLWSVVAGCWLLVARSSGGAVFAAGVGDGSDEPLAVGVDEVEEIGAAVVDFAVGEEFERGPDYGEVVVDANEGIVDALFDFCWWLRCAGAAYTVGEVVSRHLAGIAVTHEDHGCSRDEGGLDGGGVAVGHAGEENIDGGQDGLFFGGLGVEGGGEKGGGDGDCE